MTAKVAVFASMGDIYPNGIVDAKPATVCLTSAAHSSLLFSRFNFKLGFQLDHLVADDFAMRFRIASGQKINQIVLHVTPENLEVVRRYVQSSAAEMVNISIILDQRILSEVLEFPQKGLYVVSEFRAPMALGKMSKRWNEKGVIIPPTEMSIPIPPGDGHGHPTSILHTPSRR